MSGDIISHKSPAARFRLELARNQRAARAQDIGFEKAFDKGLVGLDATEFALNVSPGIEWELHRQEVAPKISELLFSKIIEETK